MKKIILVLIILLSSGCYDYKELNRNNLAVGMSIDYQEEKYLITLELIKISKEEISSFYVDALGENISDAIKNINLKSDKIPLLSHIKVFLISQNVIDKLPEITDYFIRDINIHSEFNPIVTYDNPKDILKSHTISNTTSNHIAELIQEKTNSNNTLFINNYLNHLKDNYLYLLDLKDDNIVLKGIIFTKDKSIYDVYTLKFLNILVCNNNDIILTTTSDNKTISIKINKISRKINIDNNKLYLTYNISSSIIEDNTLKDLKDEHNFRVIEDIFNKYLNNELNKTYNSFKDKDLDPLGIKDILNKKYNHVYDYKSLDYEISTNININKNGLIFGGLNEQ